MCRAGYAQYVPVALLRVTPPADRKRLHSSYAGQLQAEESFPTCNVCMNKTKMPPVVKPKALKKFSRSEDPDRSKAAAVCITFRRCKFNIVCPVRVFICFLNQTGFKVGNGEPVVKAILSYRSRVPIHNLSNSDNLLCSCG